VALTIIVGGAVFGLLAGASAVSHIRRIFGMDTRLPSEPYTVIYGMHPVVTHVLQELCDREDPVVLVAPERPPQIPAEVVFVAGRHDRWRRDLAQRARERRPGVDRLRRRGRHDGRGGDVARDRAAPEDICADRVAGALSELGVDHTLAAEQLVGHTVAKSLETPAAGDLLLQLVEAGGLGLEELIVLRDRDRDRDRGGVVAAAGV
jgi:voltage-gated potassium channel